MRVQPGKTIVANDFAPGTKTYLIEFGSFAQNNVAVTNGSDRFSNFLLYNTTDWELVVKGTNINVIDVATPYVISDSGSSYAVIRNADTLTDNLALQAAVENVRTRANGTVRTIQFGNGSTALNIGANSVNFANGSGTGNTWALVTLTGKITGSGTSITTGTVAVNGAVSVNSRADIANTASGHALFHNSTGGTVTITGGTIQANTGIAVYNINGGKVIVSPPVGAATKISSANVDPASGTICIVNGTATADRLEITGGTVENTAANANARAIYNATTGGITISGGTVQATGAGGIAVYNEMTGAIKISGGTVSATTGIAIYNKSTGKITVSQAAGATTLITSANSNPYISAAITGTINLAATGTGLRFEMTGGTVENTNTTAGNPAGTGHTIYSAATTANSVVATITGGTVKKNSSNNSGRDFATLYAAAKGTISVGSGANLVGGHYNQ
jgi:hypothetical protein